MNITEVQRTHNLTTCFFKLHEYHFPITKTVGWGWGPENVIGKINQFKYYCVVDTMFSKLVEINFVAIANLPKQL